jgi:cellulose synthase/poly-beta-1,6-N-acetylglucosamine synthase-like glycosyltransferase
MPECSTKEDRITPEVSIIVIAFNEERRIEGCLQALLAQDTSLSYEVVVVDDGSRDATAHVVAVLRERHPNVRLLRHDTNRGRGAARLSGQQSTQSPLIGFVDADIVVPPQWLERCSKELARYDAVSGIALPDGDCAVIWRICQPTLRRRPGTAEITGNNVLFTRDALARVPFGADAKLGEDFRLAKTMVRSGLRLTTLGDLVVEHRETKTYWQALRWMWRSGIDATALLFEFRVLRMPDLAWLSWSALVLGAIVAIPLGTVAPWLAVVVVVAFTLVVSCLFTAARFLLRPRFVRFLAALVLSPPLILTYLVGRCAGLVRLIGVRRSPRPLA